MKKSIFILGLIFFSQYFSSQNFKLSADNFIDVSNSNITYYVVDIPGKTKSELFNSAKSYINTNYTNLKGNGYNEVQGEQIVLTFRAVSAKAKVLSIEQIDGDFVNQYELNFKDGKMMIKPSFEYLELLDGMGGMNKANASTVLSNNRAKKKFLEALETKTNLFVSNLSEAVKKGNIDW